MALRYSHKKTLTDGATITIDHSEGYDQYKVTLGGNRTLSLTNFNDTDSLILIVEQDGTGGRTLTLDSQLIQLNDGIGEKTLVAIIRDGADNLFDSSAGSATPDTTAPTVTTATAIDANTIEVVFSEIVNATNIGWSFKQNGTPITPDSISGSGTNTLTFTFSETLLGSDTILRTYDSSTGDTLDDAGNELVSFTDQAVTNSILNEVDITFPTNIGPIVNTAGVISSGNTSGNVYNLNKGLSALKLAAGDDGYIYAQYVVSGSVGGRCIFGFNTSNSNDDWASYEASFYILDSTGALYRSEGGTLTSLSYTLTNGEYVRIIRTGSTLKLQTSSDNVTYTDRYTYTFTSAADLFININLANNANSRLHYPKGNNLT